MLTKYKPQRDIIFSYKKFNQEECEMKVAVQCESALLQRSLELFLQGNLSSLKQCDLVIRDKKIMDSYHTLYIANGEESDIKKPFSRSQLYLTLENFYKKISGIQSIQAFEDEGAAETPTKDFRLLEERIEQLTQEYKNSIMHVVKAFYE